MRKWGIIISVFYTLILLALIVPGSLFIEGGDDLSKWSGLLRGLKGTYADRTFWILAVALLGGQVLLLFLSVDTSFRRLRPRTHILVSCVVAALLTALLTTAVIWSLGVAVRGDKVFYFFDHFSRRFLDNDNYFLLFWLLIFWGALWLLWGIVFYLYYRNSSAVVTEIISWLLKGSILELLVAVPCHIIVRRRDDCSAPAVTSFGIATGLAIMLLSFGPSVLFLHKKRLDAYPPPKTA